MESDQKLAELLCLLENSYSCGDSSKLIEITQAINEYSKDEQSYYDLLFKGLTLITFNGKNLSLDLYKSIAINLKNTILEKSKDMKNEQLLVLFKKIFQLFFENNSNQNIFNESIINIFENIIKYLSGCKIMPYLEELFQKLAQTISQLSVQSKKFIIIAKIIVKFSKAIFDAKILDENNCLKIFKYYLVIIDIIFKNVPVFINPNLNVYNDDYFDLLNHLIYDIFYNLKIIAKINSLDYSKFQEIIENIFNKYCPIMYELIKIEIPFDSESEKIFINQNPVIVYNINESKCSNVNHMKSKCFLIFSYITERLSYKTNENNILNLYYIIKNEKLIQMNAEIIKLIIACFQDILKNKQKYDLVQSPKEGLLSTDNCYNSISFNMVIFFLRCLIREPIKTEFSTHIKYFVLNVIFPLLTSPEEEKDLIENDPDTYDIYLNEILEKYQLHNFRAALCYLMKKICDNFVDVKTFILSYVIEMISYIFNEHNNNIIINENNNIFNNYNIYLKDENKSLINNFNDEKKIDFCFLLIILLKDNILQNIVIKMRFFKFLLQNQDKLHHINSMLILIKICKIYKEYSSELFQYLHKEKDISIKKQIIEKIIKFLLIQLLSDKYNASKESLVSQASETISYLLNYVYESCTNDLYIKEILIEKMQECFKNLIKLIDSLDDISLNIIISKIIEKIYIKDRQDILDSLEKFTKKFLIIVNTNYNNGSDDEEIKNKGVFVSQYFDIIKYYLKGANKFDISNKNEIIQFTNIISPVISLISQPEKYTFYEDIVNLGDNYIKALNSINEISTQILDNLYPIVNSDKILSGNYFNFISTFLSHINKNEYYKPFLDKIINILKLSFTFPRENVYDEIICTLLINLQILGFENQIDIENLKYLLLENINLYFSLFINISKEELKELVSLNDGGSTIDKVRQIIVSNISLYFIYYPDLSISLLKGYLNEISYKNNDNKNNVNSNNYTLSNFLIETYKSLVEVDYYSNLGKCDVLCICALYRNTNIFNTIFDDITKKISILELLIKFMSFHKIQSTKIKTKITNDEIKCDFINDDDTSDSNGLFSGEDDTSDEFDNIFYEMVENCLKSHDIISNNDEFKVFSDTFKLIKNNNENFFNNLLSCFNETELKVINNLIFVRNIKIDYNGKTIDVPRKTLKIKRNTRNIC